MKNRRFQVYNLKLVNIVQLDLVLAKVEEI